MPNHTLDNATAIPAVALGAALVEKHHTLDRRGGLYNSFSLEPSGLKVLCEDSNRIRAALGTVNYARKSIEQSNVNFRRSLYFVKPIKMGDIITADAAKSVRPGFGLPQKYMNWVIGKLARCDIKPNAAVALEKIRPNDEK